MGNNFYNMKFVLFICTNGSVDVNKGKRKKYKKPTQGEQPPPKNGNKTLFQLNASGF